MSLIREFISYYRVLQYRIFGRQVYGIMSPGIECHHTPFEDEVNHGDVVHPCVRYISEGFLGHKWWMVYTPYYASNDKTENPILCYAKNDSIEPPTEWTVKYQVQGQPVEGYNSDPTLIYDNGRLFVMWRENFTDRCNQSGFLRATFGAEIKENGLGEVFGPLVGTHNSEIDAAVSPTFIRDKDGSYRCLAMHLKFHSFFISNLKGRPKKLISTIATFLDILGLWSQQKSYGISEWRSDNIEGPYKLERTEKIANCNKLYRPWHLDFFEHNDTLYAIVQTNQCNADICLVKSEDGVHFIMQDNPLMTNKTCGKIGLYKPTGGIINSQFYLYYTAQDRNNRNLNVLYKTVVPFDNMKF